MYSSDPRQYSWKVHSIVGAYAVSVSRDLKTLDSKDLGTLDGRLVVVAEEDASESLNALPW